MKSSDIPGKIPTPFANSAGASYIRTVPVPSQIGISGGAASYTDGFPPDCFIPAASGGYPPDGRDVNYMLKIATSWIRWQAAGGPIQYDSAFSTSIGGYPLGAVLQKANTAGQWLCTVDDNTSNPDTGGAGWITYADPSAVARTKVFTYSQSWIAPAGVTSGLISGCGAGQGGTSNLAGGAGKPIIKSLYTLVPGHTYSVVIGTAGIGTVSGGTGNNGSDTTLTDTTTATLILTLNGSVYNGTGYPSQSAQYSGSTSPGASGPFGGGGLGGGTYAGNVGGNAYGYGAGGGQGQNASGGNAAPGLLIVEW